MVHVLHVDPSWPEHTAHTVHLCTIINCLITRKGEFILSNISRKACQVFNEQDCIRHTILIRCLKYFTWWILIVGLGHSNRKKWNLIFWFEPGMKDSTSDFHIVLFCGVGFIFFGGLGGRRGCMYKKNGSWSSKSIIFLGVQKGKQWMKHRLVQWIKWISWHQMITCYSWTHATSLESPDQANDGHQFTVKL